MGINHETLTLMRGLREICKVKHRNKIIHIKLDKKKASSATEKQKQSKKICSKERQLFGPVTLVILWPTAELWIM